MAGIPCRPGRGPLHLVIDTGSHEVRAVEMTDHRYGPGEIMPGLLAQLPEEERIAVISGNGADDTRGGHEAPAAGQADLFGWLGRNGKP